MQPFGVALILIAAVSAIGYLMAGRAGGWQAWIDSAGGAESPKGDGDAGQAVGPATPDIPVPGGYSSTGANQGAGKAGSPATGAFQPAVTPVVPPASAGYVPSWTNPDSSDTMVE